MNVYYSVRVHVWWVRQAEDTGKKYDRIEEIDFEGGEIDLYFHARIQKDLPVSPTLTTFFFFCLVEKRGS